MIVFMFLKGCTVIGIFDSGFGGLTVMRHVVDLLPQYDYVYLGDNARVPYGTRSQSIITRYTEEAVDYLFRRGCGIIIIACNTATAFALRNIQESLLPDRYPKRRVLGVVRPSAEEIAEGSSRAVGILATEGVVQSRAYEREIRTINPEIKVFHEPCPLLVPIIEAGEEDWEGTELIIDKYVTRLFSQEMTIDTVLLACTHYPLLHDRIRRAVPPDVAVLAQGPLVARRFQRYLTRHPEVEGRLPKGGKRLFWTTDTSERFDRLASRFFGEPVQSQKVFLEPATGS